MPPVGRTLRRAHTTRIYSGKAKLPLSYVAGCSSVRTSLSVYFYMFCIFLERVFSPRANCAHIAKLSPIDTQAIFATAGDGSVDKAIAMGREHIRTFLFQHYKTAPPFDSSMFQSKPPDGKSTSSSGRTSSSKNLSVKLQEQVEVEFSNRFVLIFTAATFARFSFYYSTYSLAFSPDTHVLYFFLFVSLFCSRCAFNLHTGDKHIASAATHTISRTTRQEEPLLFKCSRSDYRFSLIDVLSSLHDDSVLHNRRFNMPSLVSDMFLHEYEQNGHNNVLQCV
jgi:hypothetical protein